jgi:parallel beta-helix repeat protein
MKSLKFKRIVLFFAVIVSSFLIFNCDLQRNEEENDNFFTYIECQNTSVDSTVYFVSSTDGDDSNTGTSQDNAFRTLEKAFLTVHPGGSILILPGTYSECLYIIDCGDPNAAIHVSGHNGLPVLDGISKNPIALFLENCTNLRFENLEIKNYTDIGIGASFCSNMIFKDLVVHENGFAVQLKDWELEGYGIHVEESDHIEILQNDVYQNGPNPQIIPDYLMGTGINTYSNRQVVIRNNLSHHNTGGGILVEDSYDVLVDSNEIYKNDLDAWVDEWWDGGIWLDGGGNVTICNNISRDNLGPGIEISDEDQQNPTGYVLENNISTRNYYGIFIWNFGTSGWPDDSILSRSGNQFYGNTRQDVWIEPWFLFFKLWNFN